MAVSAEFKAFVADQLAGVGPVLIKRMFGGAGVFFDGRMFALIVADQLYLKAAEADAAEFEAVGCEPFAYVAKGRTIKLPYRRCPERLYEDPEEMEFWARRAIMVSRAGKAPGKAPRARRTAGSAPRAK